MWSRNAAPRNISFFLDAIGWLPPVACGERCIRCVCAQNVGTWFSGVFCLDGYARVPCGFWYCCCSCCYAVTAAATATAAAVTAYATASVLAAAHAAAASAAAVHQYAPEARGTRVVCWYTLALCMIYDMPFCSSSKGTSLSYYTGQHQIPPSPFSATAT